MRIAALICLSLALLFSAAGFGASKISAGRAKPILLVVDPDALSEAEARACGLGELLEGRASRGFSNELLSKRRRFGEVVAKLERDLGNMRSEEHLLDPRPRSHAAFDARWLRSPHARFTLVGIANRLDRGPFTPGACGEIRFIYRLAYDVKEQDLRFSSRLPVTIDLILEARDENDRADCRAVARRWLAPEDLSGKKLGAWLISEDGPLAPRLRGRERLKSLQVNVQSLRWSAEARPDMGAQAEYLLEEFRPDHLGENLMPAPLENTPDVDLLRRNDALRASLLAWIRDPKNLKRIDEGAVVLPPQYLAEQAVSAAPYGLLRKANRPFQQIFDPKDFSDLDLENLRYARSPRALIRRLDEFSCMGCHQAQSLAGFHLPGQDPPAESPGNSLAVAFSPHVARDLPRRAAYLRALIDGRAPEQAIPFPERAGPADNGYGARCGLGDPGFRSWKCAPGLSCNRYLSPDKEVGQCFPGLQKSVGDPCEQGTIASLADPRRDYVEDARVGPCGPWQACRRDAEGYPAGMCSPSCLKLGSDGICGVIAALDDFKQCLAVQTPLAECLSDRDRQTGLKPCDVNNPCREDYVCSRASSGKGACVPAYLLLQMRVDGHPPAD